MANFKSFTGTITEITDQFTNNPDNIGCNKLISVEYTDESMINFVVTPTTYFVGHVMVNVGDRVTGFYDGDLPAILIYPPQLTAVVMTKYQENLNVKVDRFDSSLTSSDNQLKLNIAPSTKILLENGQSFTNNIENRNLIVVYGPSTRSIPAQTTPYQIVVMCDKCRF